MSTIDPVSPAPTVAQRRHTASTAAQSVFSELLRSTGVDGYQSAAPLDAGAAATDAKSQGPGSSLGELAAGAWYDWYDSERTGRYQTLATATDVDAGQIKRDFGDLIKRAYDEGGYADPKQFLSTLSSSELDSVQRVHYLAEPIDVASLTDEGALNLLIPAVAQVDKNGDGLTQSGAAYGIRFPDSRTPASVVAAWEEASADLSPWQKSTYVLQIKMPALLANFKLHEDGTFSHRIEPGDPAYQNPMDNANYSFVQATQNRIKSLDYFKSQIDPLRYQQDRAFWSDFGSRLQSHGAP